MTGSDTLETLYKFEIKHNFGMNSTNSTAVLTILETLFFLASKGNTFNYCM